MAKDNADASRRWRLKNKVHLAVYNKEWRKKNYKKWFEAWKNKNETLYRLQTRAKYFGVSVQDIVTLVRKAKCVCQICGIKLCDLRHKLPKLTKIAHIDHNHNTGQLRGLLCHSCNVGIGHLKEDVFYLESAIEYLKDTQDGI